MPMVVATTTMKKILKKWITLDADGEREEEMGDEPMGDLEMDVEMDPSDKGGDLDLSPEQKEDLAADIVRAVAQELSSALDLEEPIEVETDGWCGFRHGLGMGDDEDWILIWVMSQHPQQVTTIPKVCAIWKRRQCFCSQPLLSITAVSITKAKFTWLKPLVTTGAKKKVALPIMT